MLNGYVLGHAKATAYRPPCADNNHHGPLGTASVHVLELAEATILTVRRVLTTTMSAVQSWNPHSCRNPRSQEISFLAERLRRRPAKPMGSPRVGSNPTGVDLQGAAGNGAEAAEYESTSKTRVGNVMEATKNRERGCSRNTGQMFLPRK